MASPQIPPGDEEQSSTDFDDLQYSLQVEQENTQKRTFTSWINSQLEKHSPPSLVSDLYTDIREGHVLLDLLEVLSGQQMPREKGSNTFQCRSNIENVLTFLKNRSIKLINIHVADIIEGKPSIVLGLIWTIILHFHIEELARTLACGYSHPSPDSSSAVDSSPTASPPAKRNAKAKERWKMSAKKALLLWAKEQCATHGSISVADFKSSWRNGLAFLAIIHALRPDLVDVERAKDRPNKENLEEAFEIAETELNVPRLLEPDDVDVVSPDEKSIMTYVAQFLQYFKSLPVAEDEMQGKVNQTLSWLNAQEKKLARLLSETETMPFYEKFQEMLSFMESFNTEKKAFQSFLTSKRKASEPGGDYLKMKDTWDSLTSQMNEWKTKLDGLLPPPLDAIESWLQEVERQLAEDLLDSQDPCETMAALEGKMRSTQSLMDRFKQCLETLQSFENTDEAGLPLVPPQKLEEMRRRFSSIQLADFSNLMEYHQLFCSAILKELVSKLNIWHIKHGTKENVESLLSDWNGFIEEKGFLSRLETTFRVCKENQNKIMATSNLGADPEDASKLFKMVESQVSRCNEYIDNVNATLRKILSSWDTYTENTRLLQAWLEDTRKEHPPNVPTEVLAAWNSRHGSVNEAGNFLIESCNEEVGSAVSSELKKLNRKWAKLIKKTQFEMRLLGMQEEEVKLAAGRNGKMDSPTTAEPDDPAVDSSEETLDADSLSPDESLSEEEVKLNFEDAHKELEACILKAMQILGQKTRPEGPVSKHEEAFSILDTSILRRFLRAAEQLKDILPAREKAAVEEKSKDVRERWEAVRCEIVSYVDLKMEIERGKLNNAFSKLNKQIKKEKKLLNAGKTKGLIAEHEAIFSQQGVLGELHTSLQALKTMSKNMTEEEKQAEKKTPVVEYERKKEELQRHASAVHSELLSMAADSHPPKRGEFALASANGEKTSFLNPGNGFSTERGPGDVELEKKLQSAEKFGIHGDLSLKELQKSYHTERHNLKLCLDTIREKTASAFTGGVKDIFSLQNKLQELEALESEGDSSWKQFERMVLLLGKFSVTADESQEELLREWNRAWNALKERIHSLKAVLALLAPVESEWLQLCNADEELRQRDIPQSMLNNTSLPFKKVKKMQASIANCTKQCDLLEQGRRQRTEVDPKAWEEASAIAGEYKLRLGELGCKMQVIETILRDMETFLALLMHMKQTLGASVPLSLAPGSPGEATLQEVSLLKREAKSLDERLKQVRIYIDDDESGKKMCCEDLVAALPVNENPAVGSVEEQDISQNREAQEEFASKNSDLFKNIQDVHVKISRIGLREPTIPAVQQRLKSISELRQKLDRLAAEMRSLNEAASRLSRSANGQGEEVKRQWKLTEGLWKKAKLAIAEKQEHCARVMELLKQYHSCKNCLTGIIQKQEHTLSQQVSYMGKENLQRIIAMVNVVKQEFNNHSEDIDRINQIGKSLQSQLNKMKSLEDPPFENEANAIVDRWLDVNEWTENYCKNLERALALWDKLLNLSSSIEEWLNAELKKLDGGCLTEKELADLEAGLKSQQKNLEEFDAKVDEIQYLLNGYETPLELQVIKSSLLNKMELIIKQLPNQSIPTELNGNTAELKEDLDLAKTQIGMTESLLRSLSPSNTLGIFAKLEEIHQKILQQKHHVKLLEKETSCLNPEVVELNKQLKSVTDLFDSKMQMFQDHSMTLLNYHCQDFCDWFSSTRLNLKECFDPSETKEILEEKIQRLATFLTFEGKGSAFQEVKTLLSQVESYFPEVDVSHMSRWMKGQEAELQSMISRCQEREGELHFTLQQFARLEYLFRSLEEWLSLQEKKWQENQEEKPRLEHFYQILLKQRESFDSLAWLANSLRDSGLSKEEVVLVNPQLVDRYKTLLTCVCKSLDVSQVLLAEENNFEELAQNMIRWMQRLKDTILGLSSMESKAALEESLEKIKEILQLKEEGDAKLQNIVCLGEHVKRNNGSKNLAVERMISDVRNQWESTIQMARGYLREAECMKDEKAEPQTKRKKKKAKLGYVEEREAGNIQSPALRHDVQIQEKGDAEGDAEGLLISFEAPDISLMEVLGGRQKGGSKESFIANDQMEGGAPQLSQEWLANYEQLSSPVSADTGEEPALVVKGLKGSLIEAHNFPSSTGKSGEPLPKLGKMPPDDNLLNELQQQSLGYQKKLQAAHRRLEVPPIALPLMNGKVMGTDPALSSITTPSPESKGSEMEMVSQGGRLPEDQATADYAEVVQRVKKAKISAAELDIVLMNDQLREIENLCTLLERQSSARKQRAKTSSLWEGECLTPAEGVPDSDSVVASSWDRLLEDIMSAKKAKQAQLHSLNNYQACLAAVQSSMKHFSEEKENLKTVPPSEDTVLLENIQKCLDSIQKGKTLLQKLKAEQGSLSRHLTRMDKELIQSQVAQIDQWWKQMEDTLKRKQIRVAAQASEFKVFMDKAQELQKLLQQQHCLQTGVDTHNQAHSALMATEVQTLKNSVSMLKSGAEMQMKRMWTETGKRALESAINDLQTRVEELEQLTPTEDAQRSGRYPQAYGITRKIEEAVLWARVSSPHLDGKVALFPDNLMLEIESCKVLIGAAEEKKAGVMQLVDEARRIAPQLESGEASALALLSEQLQTCYKDLVPRLVERLEQLESQLGKRRQLFADTEKLQAKLKEAERISRPGAGDTGLKSEMDHWHAAVEKSAKEIEEAKGIVVASPQGLNVFEQLFLNDCLRSLQSRTERAHRLNQINRHTAENKVDAYEKVTRKLMSLEQDLCRLQREELELDKADVDQDIKGKLFVLKERAVAIQSSLLHLEKYKEIWECLHLKWDVPDLEKLQGECCKLKRKLEQRVNCSAEGDERRTALAEVEALISIIQKHCDVLKDCSDSIASETSPMSEKTLSWKVQHARHLTQEALRLLSKSRAFAPSFKEAKMQQIKSLGEKIDGLGQEIQSKIQAVQEKCGHEQGFQSKLGHSLAALKQIKSELQRPILLDMETQTIQCETMYCKVIEDAAEVESRAAEDSINRKRASQEEQSSLPDSLQRELDELQSLKVQLKSDLVARKSALNEAFGTVKSYKEAVRRVADLLNQREALFCTPLLTLDELEEPSLLSHQRQEELESAMSQVEALTSTMESIIEPQAKLQLEKTLGDLVSKSLIAREQEQKRKSDVQRCLEKYNRFKKSKEAIHVHLNDAERTLQKSLYRIPVSYKEALEQSEQSKMMSSRLVSIEEDLRKLRQDLGQLVPMCSENDGVLIDTVVSTLWLKWLCLLDTAKEWEGNCEEQNQEWKSVSEEMERESIILDNLQEELPENPKEKETASRVELEEFLECTNIYGESVNAEELLLRLILQRVRSILRVPECPSAEGGGLPVMNEIHTMQNRTKELFQKAQKQKDAVQSEIEERDKVNEEIGALKASLHDTESLLHETDLEPLNEKTAKLEDIQRAIDSQKQILQEIMDKLRIKYSEMYTIVPVEIETHLEDCKQTLQELEEKVTTESLKLSPHYTADKKIQDISKGLQAVENMLQQKSKSTARAKEIQKRIWDMLDLWHYKMNELDSEIQDLVEQDPGQQGQELMDRWMIPLQRYQQVSQRAERRTADLNRATSKMEECEELLKSTQVWLENTNRLLTEEAKSDSAKALNKHADALQMAFEDSEQKQSILSAIYPELEEFSSLIETGCMVQMLNKVNEQVKALQQKILEILPHIQHLADEVEAIESEVKKMEKDVDKIKTILSPSEDTLDLSPKEHLKHGQVIMAHISPMQKAIAEIQSYKESLRLPGMRLQPLSVFQRTKQLLKELKTLERMTKEQNALLEPIVKELEESEQEIDSLKQFQFMKSGLEESATEIPWPAQAASYPEGEEMEDIKQRIALLCQRKEDILTRMKNSLAELHQRPEQPELEEDILESPEPEEPGAGADWQPKKRGSLSLLPSLVEEAEDNSYHNEAVDAEEPDQQLISLSLQRAGSGEVLGSHSRGKASSSRVTNTAECLLGDSEEPVGAGRPDSELARLLHVWQAQIAELERWLDQTKESLGSGGQTRQMQQTVEQRLVACQAILSEIEQKVAHLLEDCKDRHTGEGPGLQQEAESLSSKLRDVKCNLERVQGTLQGKSAEEQISPEENTSEELPQPFYFDLSDTFPLLTPDQPLFSRQNGLEQQQELLLQLSEQNNIVDFIEVYMEKMQPQSGDGKTLELQASLMGQSGHKAPSSGSEPLVLIPKDQAGDKWQHLQEELLFKVNPPHCQFPESQISTKINILPKGATASVRTPTVEELKTYTAQLGNLSQEASVQTQENMPGEVSLSLDQKLFELLLAISRCLNDMEQMLNTCELTSEEAPVQQMLYETLSAELQKLHADIGEKKDDLLRSIASAGGNADRFSECFSNLQSWLQSTQAATSLRSKSIKAELDHYSQYQNEIRRLYGRLIMKKSLLQESFGATSQHGISKQLQRLDAHELEMQNFETQTAKLRGHVPVALIHDVHKLEDVLDDLWEILQDKQKELASPFICEQQYEALLQGLAELADLGREKVAQEIKLKATSRTNLQFHLQNHKSFFCNKAHRQLVQTCSEKVAPSALHERGKSWSQLVEEDQCLEQQAVQYGAYLERLLQDWIAFDDGYGSFCQKLEALSSAVPSVGLVEETEESLMERTQLLQQIKMEMEGEQAGYCQVVKEGKNLLGVVSCPELQVQIEKLEDQWASLSKRVAHELQRLETLLKLLSSYNRDSKELEIWLGSAQQRVRDWKEQSLNASQDLNTVRNNICNFIAFSTEVDDKSSLKSSVISTGNQLLLLKQSDAAVLRSALVTYDQRWADLIAQLPGIQEKFLQLQVAKLPSHEAIAELMDQMNQIEQKRRSEATVNAQSPTCQVKGLLKKYKEYEMEMNFKQGVVDYVNQSLLQMTTCDVKNKRYERTVFAERLGEMNLQWHRLRGSLSGKIKELEHILESADEKESRAQSLGSWLEAQSRRLKQAGKPASSILAQDTAQDCKALENQLAVKSKELDQLKQSYPVLGGGAEGPVGAMPRTSNLDEMRTRVASQVALLKTSTESALEQWRIYDQAWDEVRLMLARILYCLELSKPPVVTFETLKTQVENLQSLQDKAGSNGEIWAKFQAAACNLKKLCDPSFSEIIEQKCKEARTRWTLMNKEIEDHLHKAHASLQLWESYVGLHAEVMAKVDKYEEQYGSLLADVDAGHTMGFLKQKVEDVKMLKLDLQNIKESFLPISGLADKIAQLAEPTEPLLPEKLQPLQRISYLEKMLQMKENEFEFDLLQLKHFETCLENLENHVKGSTEVLDNLNQDTEDSDVLMSQLLVLTALSPEMESLNEFSYRFPLSDFTAKRLQNLNWQWTQKKAMALEKCCELQGIQSDEKFIQRCQKWVLFQEKMKEVLREDMAGSLEGLRKQQREYEALQAEILVNQQTFNSIMSKALHVLESGEAENRTMFLSKLTLLKEQWQSIVRAAQQRKGEIDSLVKQWQKFTTSLQDIKKILMHTSGFVAAVESQKKYSLHQLRNLSHDIKKKEILLQRWQTKHSLTLAAGEKLLDVANPEARIALQLKMRHVQETWSKTQLQLEKIRKQLQRTLQTWESCKCQTENLGNRLQELKARIKDPLPVQHAELQATKEHAKELEKSLANWNQNANKLGSMKGLAHYILAEDVTVLKEQVEHLHRQWEELCLRVSLRKQEIEDRLNAWIVFNEKNKELCAWLVQMESKVLQSADVSIEDMIDKLEKDCMEEISLFSENNLVHLKQMGEQLIKASNESKAAEIDEKLNKINDRWKHLFDVIGGRVKKLKETFSFIQLLNKNMSNLRTWLARIESELSKPVVYDTCDDQEIKKRLAEQQDLQRDIDQHSPDVDSVFCICEVLLNDSDACANQTECDSIQQTTRSLDRRWRNICAMSMERRMKIEETWQLWQKFLEDYSRFEDWLKTAERTAAYPNSSEVSYTNAKEDLKRFEAFQRQIHERLTQLELINKQYRRLARENRTDSASKLKQMVHKGNQDWDNLQKRVTAILRRLKHFTNQWEEFVGTKDSILVWLTEMDLQLTNVEHFSESNLDEKMRQLNCFQQEILLNTDKINELTMSGKHLIQKSEPSDAVVIEEELQEVHRYYQDVFGRVSRFQHRLASWPPGLEDEKETSENEADLEDARGMQSDPWCRKGMQEGLPPQQSLCHLVPPAVGHERSGCETPVSVDSIPLEWDHTGDVGDSGPQDEEEEQYYSDLSDVEIPENAEAFLKMTTKSLKAASEKSASETHTWHSPESPACRKHPYNQGEMVPSVLLNSPETSTPYKPGYVKQRSSRSLDNMQEISGMLTSEEPQSSLSLDGIAAIEKQPGGLERWELIQAQDLSNKLRMKQNRQQREQLNSDLMNINAWLDKTEKELEMLQEAEPPTSITAIHQRVKKQKDMLKAFDNYKALVLSANLTSKDFRQGDSAGSKELQNRLRQVNMRWEEAIHMMGEWRKSLQEALVGCQDFHKQNHNLLLWLAVAEVRRHQAQIKDLNADPHAIQESRRELMQLEKELLERQPQVNTLQEISTHLLVKSGGGEYVEAHEKVHVIGKKLKQLLERVSSDLKVSHGKPDTRAFLQDVDELDLGGCPQQPEKPCTYKNKQAGGRNTSETESGADIRGDDEDSASPAAPKTRGFLSRVLRMAFPLQLLFLLLLLLATLPPFSEEDYSCAHRNNFARSFHLMLRFVNGPPPF
ncbi:nesprin-2 isoform X4 [Zootoca vivipara]|uniref:nesprin-2 isoform X4 n=1 Tax=Zootoca vivipara TaxID=8524 RepID=UPI00293B92F0|nr:nesprin-2 isoform X4 [Zootoca vivipara]